MNAPGSHVSHVDLPAATLAASMAFVVAGLPVLLVALLGWVTTLDFYLACSGISALLVYVEEGELS